MKFEWDDRKAAANLRKHGVDFDLAARAFGDPIAIEVIDDREDYGEERVALIGMAGEKLLKVVYPLRGNCIRIISARRATRHEREDYHLQTRL